MNPLKAHGIYLKSILILSIVEQPVFTHPFFLQSQCVGTIATDISCENKGRRFLRKLVDFCDNEHRQILEEKVRKS
jgi:hypothetical protein